MSPSVLPRRSSCAPPLPRPALRAFLSAPTRPARLSPVTRRQFFALRFVTVCHETYLSLSVTNAAPRGVSAGGLFGFWVKIFIDWLVPVPQRPSRQKPHGA